MKLKTRIVITTLSIFIISFLFLGLLTFSNSRLNLEAQVENQVKSISQINENIIDTFLLGQEKKIELIANQNELSDEKLKTMIRLDDSFYDLFVINSSGIVTASSNPARIGLDRANRSYFVNARNQTYTAPVYFALVPREYSISVSTPFQGGVLVGAMKLNVLSNIVSDRTGLGKTGETLLAFRTENGSVIYFTPNILTNQTGQILTKEQAIGLPIDHALNGEEGVFINIKDYRNINVIASTNYIPEIAVGLVTKIDMSEAFAPISKLQKTTIFLVFIAIILTLFVIYIVAKRISEEIENITFNINQITKGDLEIQLRKSETFEINNLIDSLNRILASLKLAILRTGISKSDLGLGEAVKAKEEAEAKMKEFAAIIESSDDAIIGKTLEGDITSWNGAAEHLYGYKAKDVIGKPIFIIVPKKLHQEVKNILNKIKGGKKIEHYETIRLRKDGKEINVSITVSPIKIDGKIIGASTIAREIIKKKV